MFLSFIDLHPFLRSVSFHSNDRTIVKGTENQSYQYKRQRSLRGRIDRSHIKMLERLVTNIIINSLIIYVRLFLYSYPTKPQYTTIVNGLLNHLGVEHDTKKVVGKRDQYLLQGYCYSLFQSSWRESLISKFKRERQNLENEEVLQMKVKYSNQNSGRKLKGYSMSQMAERKIQKKVNPNKTSRKTIYLLF